MSKKVQNFLPYLFPLIAVVFVTVMFIRWYQGKTAETPVSLLDPQLQVEALPTQMQNDILKGVADYETVAMQGEGEVMGEIRYAVKDDMLSFTVTANLPSSAEEYSVWLTDSTKEAKKRVFNLVNSKAGYVGSAMLSADVMPVKVVVTKASDLMLQDSLLEADLSETE